MKIWAFILIGAFVVGMHSLIETSAHEENRRGVAHLFIVILEVSILCYVTLKFL